MAMLVGSLNEVAKGIETLNDSLPHHPLLADRLSQAHAYYVIDGPDREPLFGFSKFVGYAGMTAPEYLANYKKLDGRNTENVLVKWFEELKYGSSNYNALRVKLDGWLQQYGQRPREGAKQKVRIMVLRPEFLDELHPSSQDRKLLELLMAVADQLPISQRHELRASL